LIVVDASVALEVLLNTSAASRIVQRLSLRRSSLHAPHLIDLEVAHALRRLDRSGQLPEARCSQAVSNLAELKITRYPHLPLLARIWQLRHNLSAYDAAYVALAEALDAPLLTRDAFLASAPAHHAQIELI